MLFFILLNYFHLQSCFCQSHLVNSLAGKDKNFVPAVLKGHVLAAVAGEGKGLLVFLAVVVWADGVDHELGVIESVYNGCVRTGEVLFAEGVGVVELREGLDLDGGGVHVAGLVQLAEDGGLGRALQEEGLLLLELVGAEHVGQQLLVERGQPLLDLPAGGQGGEGEEGEGERLHYRELHR